MKRLILLFCLLFLSTGPVSAGEKAPFELESFNPPVPALDFDLPRFGGGRVMQADYQDQLILLNFWATWCIPCVKELPDLVNLEAKVAHPRFKLVTVNVMDSASRIESFLKRLGLDFTIAWDQKGQLYPQYQVKSFPASLVIDRGQVKARILGVRPWLSPESIAWFKALAEAP